MTEQPAAAENQPSFEEAHTELEEIVRTLERGETSLERTLELWERGEVLYAICAARLDAAHSRVEELTRELAEAPDETQHAPDPIDGERGDGGTDTDGDDC